MRQRLYFWQNLAWASGGLRLCRTYINVLSTEFQHTETCWFYALEAHLERSNQSCVSRSTVAHAATTMPALPSHSFRQARLVLSLGIKTAIVIAVVFVIVTRPLAASKKRFDMTKESTSEPAVSLLNGGSTQTPPPTSQLALCQQKQNQFMRVLGVRFIGCGA